MKQEEFYKNLQNIGLPVTYDHWEEGNAPELPYIVYRYPESRNFKAEGKVYFKKNIVEIELYTEEKNICLEESAEDLLDTMEITYDKTEEYIETERMYKILYEMEV